MTSRTAPKVPEPPAVVAALAATRHPTTGAALDAALEALAALAADDAFVAVVPPGRRQPEIRLTPGLDFPDPAALRDLARRARDDLRRTRLGDRSLTVVGTEIGDDVVLAGAAGRAGRQAVERWGAVVALAVARAAIAARERRRAEEMQRLNATTQRVAASLELDDVLAEIVRDAVELLGADSGDMLLLDEERQVLRVVAVANFPPEMVGFEMGTDEGVSSRAMAARRTIIVDDYERYRHRVRRLDRYRFRSVVCSPLVARGQPIGALNVHATDPARRFDQEDAHLHSAFAAHAAIAIDNARRFRNEARLAADLARANEELERSLSLQSVLAEQVLLDRGPTGVATELARLLDRPVVLQDPLLRVLAGAAPDGEDWERLVITRESGDDALEGFLDELVATGRPRMAGEGEDARLVAPVRVGKETSGYVVLPAPEPLTPLDRALVDIAVTGVALELAKLRAQVEIEQRVRGDVVTDLVTGAFANAESISARAARLGQDLYAPHDVLVVRADDPHPATDRREVGETALRRRLFDAVQEAVASWSTSSLVATVHGTTVVLAAQTDARRGGFGDRDPVAIASDLAARLQSRLPGTVVSIGVGDRSAEPGAYAASFDLACGALDALRKLGRAGEIVDGRRLGVSRLLISAADPTELRTFARRTLGPLLEADRRELLETLRAYVDAGFNQREAARRSFVHFNTVAYRLRRVEELLGRELDDPQVLLDVTLALRVAALIEESAT